MVTTGMLVLIVATGATVRLTGSGLGLRALAGLPAGRPVPRAGLPLGHRVLEPRRRLPDGGDDARARDRGVPDPGLGRGAKILAALVFAGTLAQAPLGAITVYYHLNPWLVISHLLLSLVVLGLGVLVLLEATRLVRGGDGPLPVLARVGGRRPAGGDRRARRLRDARDRGRQVPGEQRRHPRAPARLVRARRSRSTSAPSRPSGSSSSLLAAVGLAEPHSVPVADPRLRRAPRDPRARR